MRHQALALAVGTLCVLALAGMSGGMVDTAGSPEVDIPQVIDDLLTVPDQTSGAEESSVTTTEIEGWLAWAPIVILLLWVVGAVYFMNAAAAVLSALFGTFLIALYWLISFEGNVTGTTFEANISDPSNLTTTLIGVLLFVVLMTGATMLRPPAGFRSTDWQPIAAVSAVVQDVVSLVGRGGNNVSPSSSDSDNEVYQAWQIFITRVDETEDTSPGEAARVAREAGLPPDAIEAIRETFEEVRYGNLSVTESRVDRVQQAIERLDQNKIETQADNRNAQDGTDITDTF